MTSDGSTSRPVRTASAQAELERIDAAVRRLARSMGARELVFPALIAREVIDRAGYQQAFPHLLLSATREPGMGPQTGWCLSPAVCYHAYARLAGAVIDARTVLTARGVCFRGERDTAAGVRQIEFEMREIVFLGDADWVNPRADDARRRVERLARRFGLHGRWAPAEDPFFLPAAAGKAFLQRLLQVKWEYRSRDDDALALASVNRHGPFFGDRFGITDPAGRPIHTACVAVGLDRWWARARRGRKSDVDEAALAPRSERRSSHRTAAASGAGSAS